MVTGISNINPTIMKSRDSQIDVPENTQDIHTDHLKTDSIYTAAAVAALFIRCLW